MYITSGQTDILTDTQANCMRDRNVNLHNILLDRQTVRMVDRKWERTMNIKANKLVDR